MKKLLSIVLTALLVLSLAAPALALDLGVVQIGGPGEAVPEPAVDFTPGEEEDALEVKLNETLVIKDWGEITLTGFDFYDSIKLHSSENSTNRYSSGVEADYAILYLDIVNTGLEAHDFLALAPAYSKPVVRVVYKDMYEYEGRGFQVNLDWDENGLNGLATENNFPIKPMYAGHYMIVCKLPNAVVERKDSLTMTFILDEIAFTYTIRQ